MVRALALTYLLHFVHVFGVGHVLFWRLWRKLLNQMENQLLSTVKFQALPGLFLCSRSVLKPVPSTHHYICCLLGISRAVTCCTHVVNVMFTVGFEVTPSFTTSNHETNTRDSNTDVINIWFVFIWYFMCIPVVFIICQSNGTSMCSRCVEGF